jgi:hypothetical protein
VSDEVDPDLRRLLAAADEALPAEPFVNEPVRSLPEDV